MLLKLRFHHLQINYLLITNGTDVFGLQFDNEGNSIKRTSLQIDEELDIISIIKKYENKNISYNIIKEKKYTLETRNQIQKQKYILQELIKIKKENNIINYLHYECFNKEEKNKEKALNHLLNSIQNNNICNKIYEFLKLIKTTNN